MSAMRRSGGPKRQSHAGPEQGKRRQGPATPETFAHLHVNLNIHSAVLRCASAYLPDKAIPHLPTHTKHGSFTAHSRLPGEPRTPGNHHGSNHRRAEAIPHHRPPRRASSSAARGRHAVRSVAAALLPRGWTEEGVAVPFHVQHVV